MKHVLTSVALLVAQGANAQTPTICVSGDISFTVADDWVTVTRKINDEFRSFTVNCQQSDSGAKVCDTSSEKNGENRRFDAVTILPDGTFVWTRFESEFDLLFPTKVFTDINCQGALQ